MELSGSGVVNRQVFFDRVKQIAHDTGDMKGEISQQDQNCSGSKRNSKLSVFCFVL